MIDVVERARAAAGAAQVLDTGNRIILHTIAAEDEDDDATECRRIIQRVLHPSAISSTLSTTATISIA